ncbi:MAG TPA: PQQ-dependent sugar dehydrogenase [Thermoanaerobaculia bacterium]|nr:PQQ-dependent sugar dehydrogenase [Thermoanaerobaculia bacterium]
MTLVRSLVAALVLTVPAAAAVLPGFRIETLVRAEGFVSSVATDSQGTIYFTTTDGWIHRVDGIAGTAAQATRIASVHTHPIGNGGLLGMALVDDHTAVIHYTVFDERTGEPTNILDDVVSRIDLATGAETVVHSFVCDIRQRLDGASPEHHGGNLTVAPDGSILLGIGDYGTHVIAQDKAWNAGKIWKIDPQGNTTQWARGMRNPYDLAWDPDLGRIVVSDNGPDAGDELNVIDSGANCGWPRTYGNEPPLLGAVAPSYVFADTVAPTGIARLDGANPMLRRGYLLGAFVTRAIYYFPTPSSAPTAIVNDFDEFVIDVTQAANGDVLFATAGMNGTAIHRLRVPPLGDCNGDGFTDYHDVLPLMREIADGDDRATIAAQAGTNSGSWGCDANADGTIDAKDLQTLTTLIRSRRRSVRAQ